MSTIRARVTVELLDPDGTVVCTGAEERRLLLGTGASARHARAVELFDASVVAYGRAWQDPAVHTDGGDVHTEERHT